MEHVVSVEDDYHVISHERSQRAFLVLDVGWGRADSSGAPGVSKNVIFTILEARHPEKDAIDRGGKTLFHMFEVSAREGERLGEWSARAESVFKACQRDVGIAFPNMVKEYLCLHRCGLSDDRRAVVLGRIGGKNEIAANAPALRSRFPEYRVPKLSRRSHGVFVSEMLQEMEEEKEHDEEDSSDDLSDVE